MTSPEIFIVSGEPENDISLAEFWNAGIDKAAEIGAEWIFFQEPGVDLKENALTIAAPALQAYDAVWGAMDVDGSVSKLSTFTCDDPVGAWHMALVWWVGRSHFVKTEVAAKLRFDATSGAAWFAEYLIRIWQSWKCLKTAQPYVRGTGHLTSWGDEEKRLLVEFLANNPQFISIEYGGHPIKFPYTGKNPTIERNQLRGVFFEQRDLEALKGIIEPGSVVVDVGANTGNHTVFFAAVLKAQKVIVIEPNPETARFLKTTVAANGLDQVDFSNLGIGAGEKNGKLYLKTGRRGHLGTATLELEGDVAVDVKPLDDMISERVDFVKIDVEGMEVDVLKGARNLFERDQPAAFVEVQDENSPAFLAILKELGYRIDRIFADHGYANYLIMPKGNI